MRSNLLNMFELLGTNILALLAYPYLLLFQWSYNVGLHKTDAIISMLMKRVQRQNDWKQVSAQRRISHKGWLFTSVHILRLYQGDIPPVVAHLFKSLC